MLRSLLFFAIKIAAQIVATPLNDASKADELVVVEKLERVLLASDGCSLAVREPVSFVFVLRFDKTGAVSEVAPSYVPEASRKCLQERVRKVQLSAKAAERGYAVNISAAP